MQLKLTAQQQNIWNVMKTYQNTSISNIGASLHFTAPYDYKTLNQMVHMLISNNAAFHLRFGEENDVAYQFFQEESPKDIEEIDLCGKNEEEIITIILQKVRKPFTSMLEPLYRFYAVKRIDGQCCILIVVHHLINDAWSMSLIAKELVKYYRMLTGSEARSVKNPSFVEAIHSEQEYFVSADYQKSKEYWKEVFAKPLRLCLLKNKPEGYNSRTKVYAHEIDRTFYGSIVEYCKKNGITLVTLFEAAIMAYLHWINERAGSVTIGTILLNRKMKDKNTVGMFVSTMPLCIDIGENDTMLELCKKVGIKRFELFRHQKYPFVKILEDAKKHNPDITRLFDVFVSHPNAKIGEQDRNVSLKWYNKGHSEASLCLHIEDINDTGLINLHFEYRVEVLEDSEVVLLCQRILNIIRQTIEKNAYIKDLQLISEEEKEKVLYEFNQTASVYQKNKTVVELFEEQVEKTPDKTAVVYEDKSLTYRELNEKANQVAHMLRKKGVGRENCVAMLSKRGLEMFIGIYGIIKAGAAYVPMEPDYPEDRIKFMIEDCNPKAILTYRARTEGDREMLDLGNAEIYEGESRENPVRINRPEDLLYVIYTSGTTGKPKGVMIEHKGVVCLRNHLKRSINPTENDRVLQFASYVFDASVWEITSALYFGAALIIPTAEKTKDAQALTDYCHQEKVSNVILPPNYYILMEGFQVRTVVTGGSESSHEIVAKAKNSRYINAYGPTENTVVATQWEHSDQDDPHNIVPIGKPVHNTKVYIMDREQLCGIGMAGELCIAGDSLARGYLNREELTKEKFVDNPFGEGKMYRSGDLACWLADGNIEYQGRIDEQVKIRGFRIELGEIENVLRKQPGVKDAAVIARKDKTGDKSLYGYVVADDTTEISILREGLFKELPEYMVPGYLMKMDKFPVNTSGKVDKKKLPEIEAKAGVRYVAPRNAKERILCEIFQEVLGAKDASVKDSFFALGGDSIKAMRVVSKMREAGYDLSVGDAMSGQTIEAISELAEISEEYACDQGEITGEIKATPIIEAFKSWEFKEPHHFNQSILIKVDGREEEIEESIKAVMSHHDMLRGVFAEGTLRILGNEEKRHEYEVYDCRINEKEIDEEIIEKVCDEKQRTINLEKGPLAKFVLFKGNEGNFLFMCLHHLVVDGVSWRILAEDIQSGIKQLQAGKEIKLPKKTASFKEWSEALSEYKESQKLKQEIDYWTSIETEIRDKMKDEIKEVRYADDVESIYDVISLELSQADTLKLLRESSAAYKTEINDLLLSALGMTLQEIKGREKASIMLEGHGRERLHKNIVIDRTVGWFTSMYPILLECRKDVEESILATREMLRKVPNHGIGYGLISKNIKRCEMGFNYLGEMEDTKAERTYRTGRDVSEKNLLPGGSIIMNGIVENGRLIFDISYERSLHDKQEINELAGVFKMKLLQVIHHCTEAGQTNSEGMEKGHQKTAAFRADDYKEIHDFLAKNKIGGPIAPKQKLGDTLIAGATGWLGAHILDSFLSNETGKAYCLVRGENVEAGQNKLQAVLSDYFGNKYRDCDRIITICGDLEDKIVVDRHIDTIFNCAASVRHYGLYKDLYDINVGGTQKLIGLAKEKGARLFHISTNSVSGADMDSDPNFPQTIFCESDLFIGQPLKNVYIRSKFESEVEVLKAKLEGLEAVVLRVGNLSNRHIDLKFQKNYQENAILNRWKAFADLGMFPETWSDALIHGLSAVDLSAEAIIKLAQHYHPDYSVFHAYSDKTLPYGDMARALHLSVVDLEKFVYEVKHTVSQPERVHIYEAFHGEIKGRVQSSNIIVKNDFTIWYLQQIGFSWQDIDYRYAKEYAEYFEKIGFWKIHK